MLYVQCYIAIRKIASEKIANLMKCGLLLVDSKLEVYQE